MKVAGKTVQPAAWSDRAESERGSRAASSLQGLGGGEA